MGNKCSDCIVVNVNVQWLVLACKSATVPSHSSDSDHTTLCRSAPRCNTHRSAAALSVTQEAELEQQEEDGCTGNANSHQAQAVQDSCMHDIELIVPANTPLTKSKALRRLAALQVCSPMDAASPVPLRRRLQGRKGTAAALEHARLLRHDDDIICIDC